MKEKLETLYRAFYGDTHTLTFEEYLCLQVEGYNSTMKRCGLETITLEQFLAL